MKTFWLFILFASFFANAQESFELTDFSNQYTAKIIVNNNENNELDTNGTLNIYQKKNAQLIFFAPVFYSEYDFENAKIKTNIKVIPYGEQSVLIYEDFNFDGIKDIALRTGFYGCYGGPSYEIYLADKNGFVYNESFTDLGSNYCGMFSVDNEKKQLQTSTKSGCCWHQFTTYIVENNEAVPVEIVEEYYSGIFVEYTVQKRVNGKMVESGYLEFTEENKPEFTMTFKNGKKMYLLEGMNNDLIYVFTDKNNVVELTYNEDFVFNQSAQTVTFQNKNTTYILSEKEIIIKDGAKTYHLNNVQTTNGAFSQLKWNTLSNVQIK